MCLIDEFYAWEGEISTLLLIWWVKASPFKAKQWRVKLFLAVEYSFCSLLIDLCWFRVWLCLPASIVCIIFIILCCSCARNAVTKEEVAIKKIGNAFDNRIDAKRTLREIKLLSHMDHENVIYLHTKSGAFSFFNSAITVCGYISWFLFMQMDDGASAGILFTLFCRL